MACTPFIAAPWNYCWPHKVGACMGVGDTFKTPCAAGLALLLAGMLSGCAAYEKCGFGGCAGDAEISAAVRVRFSQHPGATPAGAVSVQTLNGVVYLYGVVDT